MVTMLNFMLIKLYENAFKCELRLLHITYVCTRSTIYFCNIWHRYMFT